MKSSNDFSMLLTSFLSKYLPGQRNVSTNTVMSYRDNFKLFICYCTDERGFLLKGIQMQCIDRKMVLDYLGWLELKRGCSISTRNQRLAAFKSFFHYVATETPDYLFQCQLWKRCHDSGCALPSHRVPAFLLVGTLPTGRTGEPADHP